MKKAERLAQEARIAQELPGGNVQDRKPSKMKIHEITARNFMGRDSIEAQFVHPLTMIVGRNMRGKSAILRAIKLALLGWLPGIPKKDHEIFNTLSSGDAMSVALNIGGTHLIEHAWALKGGSVKADHRFAANLPATPIVSLDARAYFSMTAQERIGLVFQTMRLENVPLPQRIQKIVREMETAGLEGPAIAVKKITTVDGDNFQGWIERALGRLREAAKENGAGATRMQKTVEGLAHLENQSEAPGAASIAKQLTGAREELERLIKEHSKAQAPFEAFKQARQQRARHNELIKRTQAGAATFDQCKADHEAAKTKVDGFQLPETTNLQEKYTEARSAAGVTASKAEAAETALREFEATQQKLVETESCPTCKRPFEKGKLSPEAKAEAKKLHTKLKADLKAAKEHAQTASSEAFAVHADLKAAMARHDEYRAAKEALEDAAEALRLAAADKTTFDESTAALAELGGDPQTSEDGAAEVQRLAEAVDAKREEIEKLEETERQAQASVGGVQKLVEARNELERFTSLAKSNKAAVKLLEDAREGFIADAFKPMLKVANQFAAGIESANGSELKPLVYSDGEFKRASTQGRLYSMGSFSTAEEAITYAAINAALGAGAPAKIVLMDDMVHIDPINKQKFIENILTALNAKTIEQFIGVDIDSRVYDQINSDGGEKELVKVIELT